MLDTLFSITALVGGTVLGFQFVMMLLGMGGDDAGDVAAGEVPGDVVDVGGIDGGLDGSLNGSFEADGAIGGDTSTGHDLTWSQASDADLGHPDAHWFYEIISLRTLSAAIMFFGLVGKTMLAYGHTPPASFVYASLAGAAAMYGVFWLFQQVYKLQNAGNENIRRAIGLPATVYVPVPAGRAGAGKVMFRLQDRTVEYLAVTNEPNKLATGEKVVIVGIVNNGTVRVARESQPAAVEVPA